MRYRTGIGRDGIFALVSILILTSAAVSQTVEFDAARWNLDRAEVQYHEGRSSLSGTALLRDVMIRDGLVEVDIYVTGAESRPGIIVRHGENGAFERISLRPHRAGVFPDAVQYTPVFNGIESWQLYYGPGYTAEASIPTDRWTRLRLEFSGSQARLFIGGAKAPALVVHDLKHAPVRGTIGLEAPTDGSAYFSRFHYRQDETIAFPSPPPRIILPGTVTRWSLSRVFPLNEIDFERTPEQQRIGDPQWLTVESEANGLVNIARYRSRSGNAPDCVFARTVIRADDDEVREFRFGYSDAIAVFCNGRLLFSGNSARGERGPSFLGVAGYHDAVYLPLEDGENELIFCIAEWSGGWGFMCRDGDAEPRDPRLEPEWDITRDLRFPESVVWDAERELFYASNLFPEGDGFLSKISPDGELLARRWVNGLNRPTGLALHAGMLYAVDRTGVAEIDPATGVITRRIEAQQPQFLNDITFDDAGVAYVSDSRADCIFRMADGTLSCWRSDDGIADPNGLFFRDGELFFGNSGDATVRAILIDDGSMRTVAQLDPGSIIDGLTGMSGGRLLASAHEGRVFEISPEGDVHPLLDRRTTQRFCADFAWVPELRLLVIPSLRENSITAFSIEK